MAGRAAGHVTDARGRPRPPSVPPGSPTAGWWRCWRRRRVTSPWPRTPSPTPSSGRCAPGRSTGSPTTRRVAPDRGPQPDPRPARLGRGAHLGAAARRAGGRAPPSPTRRDPRQAVGAALRLRPPGGGPGGAHPAHAPGRARLRRGPHRPRVRRAARGDGPAPGPGQATHPRCRHPVPCADRAELPARLPAVLEAIYGAYAIDWLDQHERIRESIADEARWLAVLTATPARHRARGMGPGRPAHLRPVAGTARTARPWPPLDQQDTALWDRSLIAEGESLLRRAHTLGAPARTLPARGRDPVRALRPGTHRDLDRATVVQLYRGLVATAPTAGAAEALAALTGPP